MFQIQWALFLLRCCCCCFRWILTTFNWCQGVPHNLKCVLIIKCTTNLWLQWMRSNDPTTQQPRADRQTKQADKLFVQQMAKQKNRKAIAIDRATAINILTNIQSKRQNDRNKSLAIDRHYVFFRVVWDPKNHSSNRNNQHQQHQTISEYDLNKT